ncbi:MAG TPA: PH domain-containing protein [Candidatus Dormibacteraeota bacterium]
MSSELLPGENLVLKAHQHWIVIVKSLVFPIALLILMALIDIFFHTDSFRRDKKIIVTLVVVAIAGLWLIVVWVRWQATAYTLTDQRIKIETGVFGRSSKTIPIDRIQDATTRQTVFGRMLGYGRVEVDAAGAQGAEVLDHMPNPGAFRDQVFMLSERRRGGASGAPAPANPSGV